MRYTNRKGLPDALVRACEQDPYDPGTADISITRLIAPPRQVALMKQHADELVGDVADRIWALRSQGIHAILERAAQPGDDQRRQVLRDAMLAMDMAQGIIQPEGDEWDSDTYAGLYRNARQMIAEKLDELSDAGTPPPNEIAEVRWERQCLGWRVSGKLDLVSLADGVLTDWKDTSVWSIKDALDPKTTGKVEWEQQTNLLAYFAPSQYRIRAVQVVAFGRDWRKNEKLRYGEDYPNAEVSVIPLPLWQGDFARGFLEARVAMHQEAQAGRLPDCTPEERWEKPTTYAVTQVGRKTAVRLYGNRADADTHAASQPDLTVVVRPGSSPRCAQYCDALPFCTQGQKIVAEATPDV